MSNVAKRINSISIKMIKEKLQDLDRGQFVITCLNANLNYRISQWYQLIH
ncbi:hypothetical protein [Turicibacter sanguinis]|nr:hypothetical protein [Turicibacter sanguinis]